MRPNVHDATSLAVIERCRLIGLPALRCGLDGSFNPASLTPAERIMLTSPVSEALARAAAGWSDQIAPGIYELSPSLWAIPVPIGTAAKRVGYNVALAIGPGWTESAACGVGDANAPNDAAAVRASLASGATHTRASAELVRTMLRCSTDDLGRVIDQSHAVEDLTKQLTDSYETLDALYSIGRSMNDLARPGAFVSRAASRLHASLNFQTVAVSLSSSPLVITELRGECFVAGKIPEARDETRRVLSSLVERVGSTFLIATNLPPLTDEEYPEALVQPIRRNDRTIGVLTGLFKTGADRAVSSYDIQFLESAAGYMNSFLQNAAMYEEQRAQFLGTLQALTAAIDAKDRYTRGHSDRVAHLSHQLALASGMSAEEAERVRIAGQVHDVGKIGVPEVVLCKQGRLTDEEFEHIKKHPEIGHRILRGIPPMADLLPGVLYHHEKYNGHGYPHGLAGEAIPLMARIIAIADTFDAMSSTRSYRAALQRDHVLGEIRKCGGTQFDPALAEKFVTLDFTVFDQMVREGGAASALSAAA